MHCGMAELVLWPVSVGWLSSGMRTGRAPVTDRALCAAACLFLLLLTTLPQSADADFKQQSMSITICTNQIRTIDCGTGARILIENSWFGLSKYTHRVGCLAMSHDQKIAVLPTSLLTSCDGQRKCSIRPDEVLVSDSCVDNKECLSTYQIVNYACVKDMYNTEMCKEASLERDRSYITSPNFPDDIKSKIGRCECSLESDETFDITLVSNHLSKDASSTCKQMLAIDAGHTKTIWACGAPVQSKVMQKTSLKVIFYNKLGQNGGRFWIFYKGDDIKVRCTRYNESEAISTTTESTTTMSTTTERVTTVPSTAATTTTTTTTIPTTPTMTKDPTSQKPLNKTDVDFGEITMSSTEIEGGATVTTTMYPYLKYKRPSSHSSLSYTTISALIGGFVGGIVFTAAIFLGIIWLLKSRRRKDSTKQPIVNRQDSASTLSGYTGLHPSASSRTPIYAILRPREGTNGAAGEGDLYEVIPYDYAYSPANRTSEGVPPPTMPRLSTNNARAADVADNASHNYLSLLDDSQAQPLASDHGYLRPLPSLD